MGRDSEGRITRRVKDPETGYYVLTAYSLEETAVIDAARVASNPAAAYLETVLIKLGVEADRRVGLIIDSSEKAHWMGVADAISRKQSLWVGDQLSDTPDPAAFPPLTPEEKSTWESLAAIQGLTAAVRQTAVDIEIELGGKTEAELLLLLSDETWIPGHILWA